MDNTRSGAFFFSFLFSTTQTAVTNIPQEETQHTLQHHTAPRPPPDGSSSSGASALDHAGSEEQADPCMDMDPANVNSMPPSGGSSSSGASAVDHAGKEYQEDISIDVDVDRSTSLEGSA